MSVPLISIKREITLRQHHGGTVSAKRDAETDWIRGGNQLWNANVSDRSPRKSTPSLYLKNRR